MRPMLLWTIYAARCFEGDARCLALPDSNGPYAASLRISTISGTAIRGPFYQNLPCVHIEGGIPHVSSSLTSIPVLPADGSHVGREPGAIVRTRSALQSQRAQISQRIGITDITIAYHRPLVNDRKVWDALVPYGKVWRAGANENTTITFSDPVQIEGKPLDKGTYGLHMIPTPMSGRLFFPRTRLPGDPSPTTKKKMRSA